MLGLSVETDHGFLVHNSNEFDSPVYLGKEVIF